LASDARWSTLTEPALNAGLGILRLEYVHGAPPFATERVPSLIAQGNKAEWFPRKAHAWTGQASAALVNVSIITRTVNFNMIVFSCLARNCQMAACLVPGAVHNFAHASFRYHDGSHGTRSCLSGNPHGCCFLLHQG
jgi:hypothetical protein